MVARDLSFDMLLCPSDFLGNTWRALGGDGIILAKSNYLGFFSGLNDGDGYSAVNPLQHGVFRYTTGMQGTPVAEIRDGTSSTMALAEYLKGVDSNDARGSFWSNRAGMQTLFVTLGPNSTVEDNLTHYFCPTGGSPHDPANNLPCTPGSDDANFASPRSRHPGGVNVVFCDGSVHFIQNSVDATTWQSLGWIADGGIVTDY